MFHVTDKVFCIFGWVQLLDWGHWIRQMPYWAHNPPLAEVTVFAGAGS